MANEVSRTWYEASTEAGRRRDNPGQAPLLYSSKEAQVWTSGYAWAMNELAQKFNMKRIESERKGE